jgi:hypothetical protein
MNAITIMLMARNVRRISSTSSPVMAAAILDSKPKSCQEALKGALAVVEGCWHRYSKNLRPAPILAIDQSTLVTSPKSRTVSPFENLAAAQLPLITMSCTTAPANDR